jgi:hydroxylysine kinase
MLLDPTLTTQPPQLTRQDAEMFAQRFYGLELNAHPLSGERDRNFRMDGQDGRQFLLKFSNPAEAVEIVNLQTCVLNHIRQNDPALPIPHVVAASSGAFETAIELDDGRLSILRMLTFLPGTPLHQSERSREQRRALGRCLARLDRALEGFTHPAASHDLLWNVAAAHRLKAMIKGVADPARRQLVQNFMAHYEVNVLPQLTGLRAQLIHNDFNLGNVLVDPDDSEAVAAVIDFGDVVHAPLVGEIATAAAYQLADGRDPLRGAAEMIGAYDEVLPLQQAEKAVLLDLVTARLVITVLITEWRAARYPDNYQYIMRNNGLAWNGLDQFGRLSRDEASEQLLQFCSSGDK